VAADGLGGIPCGWQVKSKDGSVMSSRRIRPGAGEGAAHGRSGRHGDRRHQGQAKDAALLVEVNYDPLPAVAHLEDAVAGGAPRVWDEAPGNLCFDWHLGDAAATDAQFSGAARVVSIDLVNNRIIPTPSSRAPPTATTRRRTTTTPSTRPRRTRT